MYSYVPIDFASWRDMILTAAVSSNTGFAIGALIIGVVVCVAVFKKVLSMFF